MRDTLDAYLAVALARMGRSSEAATVLDSAQHEHGLTDAIREARAHIETGVSAVTRAVATGDNRILTTRASLQDLTSMDATSQAQVIHRANLDVFVTSEVRDAAARVIGLVPMMRGLNMISFEDDVSALLANLLEARVAFLGWTIPDQTKGGFTAKGNPGERDLCIKKAGTVLCVLEAVVCKRAPATETMRKELASHLQRLFAYANCRVFAYLVYSYFENPGAVLIATRDIATTHAPDGFTHIETLDLPVQDSRPPGFTSVYAAADGREAVVVFLVLDLRLNAQRRAAVQSQRTKKGSQKPKTPTKKRTKTETLAKRSTKKAPQKKTGAKAKRFRGHKAR